jgi:hypothetical protein
LNNRNLSGAQNLLVNCGAAIKGEKLLICYEPYKLGFYDKEIVNDVYACAIELGLHVTLEEVGFDPLIAKVPHDLEIKMSENDLTVFLARLADQMRFESFKGSKRSIISYALTGEALESPFGFAHYQGFVLLKQAIDRLIFSAENVEVKCRAGTSFSGALKSDPEGSDVNLSRFPMLVSTPVPAIGFSGKVALPGFLVGTGSKYYSPFGVIFDGLVLAIFEGNQLIGFEGSRCDVEKANQHLDYVSKRFNIERNYVHSWHLGIHPGCYFKEPATENFETWTGSAFGNPRLLHFHTCGSYAPGEICWNIVDPTVVVDGNIIWKDGAVQLNSIPGAEHILKEYPSLELLFRDPDQRIGI